MKIPFSQAIARYAITFEVISQKLKEIELSLKILNQPTNSMSANIIIDDDILFANSHKMLLLTVSKK